MAGNVIVWLALAVTVSGGGEPGTPLSRFESAETHMGSEFKIILYSPDGPAARRACRAAFDRIKSLDEALSDYNPESELMRLCDRAGGPPTAVGADLYDVLADAKAMAGRSGGAFDPTVGPLVRLWRRARRDGKMPADDALARARALVSAEMLTLDPADRTVRLGRPGMKLDLGGIAKGYASGEAVKVLRREGLPRALVAGAGDIVAGDPPPGLEGWSVGVGPLENPGAAPERFISLRNAAVSTSGDAEKYVEIGGRRYSHIVDPRTGLGVVDRCSVTVVAPDGATADALDTAVYALGPDRGLPLVEATPGASALIVRSTPEGRRVYESRHFPPPAPKPAPVAPRPD